MEFGSLFRIVSRVSENLRVKATLYSITTEYYNSMLAGLHKLIVKQNFPLCMIEFPMTVCHEVSTGSLTTEVFRGEIFETIWKLENGYA